jgi:hypothetical protein
MTEREFQRKVKRKILETVPDAVVTKTDPTMSQGIPDLLILLPSGRFAALEVKTSAEAPHRPNQDYWVERLDKMGYSSFVYPENLNFVLDTIARISEDIQNDI